MGWAMMIGVAQLMGRKPIFKAFFSSAPGGSWAKALAASRGKTLAIAAMAPPAPARLKN